jgi:hypothetical protein
MLDNSDGCARSGQFVSAHRSSWTILAPSTGRDFKNHIVTDRLRLKADLPAKENGKSAKKCTCKSIHHQLFSGFSATIKALHTARWRFALRRQNRWCASFSN